MISLHSCFTITNSFDVPRAIYLDYLPEGLMVLVFTLVFLCYLSFSHGQEKRLRVNMRLKKLQEKVKEQQEKVGEKVNFLIRKSWL